MGQTCAGRRQLPSTRAASRTARPHVTTQSLPATLATARAVCTCPSCILSPAFLSVVVESTRSSQERPSSSSVTKTAVSEGSWCATAMAVRRSGRTFRLARSFQSSEPTLRHPLRSSQATQPLFVGAATMAETSRLPPTRQALTSSQAAPPASSSPASWSADLSSIASLPSTKTTDSSTSDLAYTHVTLESMDLESETPPCSRFGSTGTRVRSIGP
mmetsp:Transcript_195/g.757  ORF Transcript_195/g.757 Transcript_195/m.757 type:complete len:216 (-) Transcript_195:941-1588(-)